MMGDFATRLYGGNFVAESDPQFVNLHNQYTLGFGLSAGFANNPYHELDVEYFFANRDYDTQLPRSPFGTIDNDTSIETQALLVGARAVYPKDGIVRAYAVAGWVCSKQGLKHSAARSACRDHCSRMIWGSIYTTVPVSSSDTAPGS